MLQSNSRLWLLGLVAVLASLSLGLFRDFTAPWTTYIDANGACWSQSAHNTLRAGLVATAGAPSAFYFGTPPIPPEGYYTHHPPLLSLLLTAQFALLGEHEWAARLLPIVFSLLGVIMLWVLVRDCINARAATFACALFAAMPMEIHYGRMVNFEPIDLVWMLGALYAHRRWEQTGRLLWRNLLAAFLFLALWTAWLGYLFALVLCLHFRFSPEHKYRRFSSLIMGMCVVCLGLFFWQMLTVQPAALDSVIAAFRLRLASTGVAVTWTHWLQRMIDLLLLHIQPASWALAAVGCLLVLRVRRAEADLRWLGWAAMCLFEMNAVYVIVFRNASSIHDYASFYFLVPVAIFGAILLDRSLAWIESKERRIAPAALCLVITGLAILTISGLFEAVKLRKNFHILTVERPEPPSLIPDLGRAMQTRFPEDTAIICNFLPYYGPQLHYYAQRDLLAPVVAPDEWKAVMQDPGNTPFAGVVWLGDARAKSILSVLPPGSREDLTVDGIRFCFWRPNR